MGKKWRHTETKIYPKLQSVQTSFVRPNENGVTTFIVHLVYKYHRYRTVKKIVKITTKI